MSSPTIAAKPASHRRGSRAAALFVLAFALSAAPAVAGCAGGNPSPAAPSAVTTTHQPGAATPMSSIHQDAAKAAAWAAKPVYVRSDARIEQAYAYALAAPEVLHWLPCYCGCEAMGHGSNADCFFTPSSDGGSSLTFEEHASFCGICVDTALMAKQMRGDGQSLRAIRDAVDARFGGTAPGTPTELPPA